MASGDLLCTYHPYRNEPPSSNYMTVGLRNGHPMLQADDTTAWAAIFTDVLPPNYSGGGLTMRVHYTLASAVAGNVVWTAEIERMDDNGLDLDADSFAAAQSSSAKTVPGTSGVMDMNTVALTNTQIDGLLAGEVFRTRIKRDPATDTAVGNAEIEMIEVRET